MVLPLALFRPLDQLPEKERVKLYSLPHDLVKLLVKQLSPEAFHTLALGDRRCFQILYDIARKVVEERWPHIFHKYNQPEQDWIQIYCAKMQERRNLVEGRCELVTLSRNLPSGWDSFPLGTCLGKVLVRHVDNSVGTANLVWPPLPLHFHNQLDVVSLKNGNILKSLELDWHHVAADCIWRQKGNDLRGWNVHTGELEYHFVITAPLGFRCSAPPSFRYSVRQYLDLTIYQCTFTNPQMIVERIFIIDRITKKLRECLPPANFNRLRLHEKAFLTESLTPKNTVSFLWCRIPRGGTIEEQVIATYSLTDSDHISATDIRNFNFDFQENWKVDQLEHHYGFDLVKAFHATEKSTHWFLFDSKGNQIFSPNDRIPHSAWAQGKFYIIKEDQGHYTLHNLDSETQLLNKGYLLEYPVLWMFGIETSLLILLRTLTGLEMRVLNIQTEEWTIREFPCQIDQGIHVEFVENVLSVIPDKGPPLVFHFSGKLDPVHRELQLVLSPHWKAAEVTDLANFDWKSRKTPKMKPSLPLIRRFAEHCSKYKIAALACLVLAVSILQIKRSDGLESFFYQR